MRRISRRRFLATASASAGAMALGTGRLYAAATRNAVAPRLSQFQYADVQLLDGPMLEQFRQNHAFFLALGDGRLLKPFRQCAGLPAPGEDMGGWYSFSKDFDPPRNMTGYIPGHTFGQYLSGLSRAYAVTGSKQTQEKVHGLVRGFAETVTGKFYEGYPLPAYTFDKINCGLIDAHAFAADLQAMKVLDHATDAVLPFLPEKALTRPEMEARPHKNISYTWDESYTLPENLFLAYERGGGERYRKLAERFLQDKDYFDPLAEGRNVLPGEHAYSHLNALCSAMQAYLVTGDEKYLRAARNGFDFVVTTQSFATGGWGPNETFRRPGSGELGESLTKTHASFETPCGAYGHFKIARYLMRVTGDSRYGDSMERVLHNTILGAKPILEDGRSFYYSDYNNEAQKGYHPDKWPCCSGTFPQITADYGISSYFLGNDGVYVNLFVPSTLRWRQGGAQCALTQRTGYPHLPEIELELRMERPERFAIALRIPAWAGAKTRVAVDGKRTDADVVPGRFLSVQRTWRDGDRVEVEFDMPTRLEAVDPQHPGTVALLHGPLALFGVGDLSVRVSREKLLAAQQSARGSAEWSVESGGGRMTMRPFAAIGDEKYRLYHEVAT